MNNKNEEEDDDEDEEDEEEEETDEQKQKKEELGRKIDEVMSLAGETMFDPDMIKQFEKVLHKVFAKNGIPYQMTYLKAFLEGALMSVAASSFDKGIGPALPIMLKTIITRMDKKIQAAVDNAEK